MMKVNKPDELPGQISEKQFKLLAKWLFVGEKNAKGREGIIMLLQEKSHTRMKIAKYLFFLLLPSTLCLSSICKFLPEIIFNYILI